LARQVAERVRETHQTLVLKPMSSSDRRIIHSALAQTPDLATESIGEDPERRIVIKLKK
jgi:spoIIIJ-associated protein